MQITTHIVIERPIREVFAFASNPCCWTQWIAGAAPVRHTWSGQFDMSTTFRQAAPLASFWDDTSPNQQRVWDHACIVDLEQLIGWFEAARLHEHWQAD